MTDPNGPISRDIRDASAKWLARRQRPVSPDEAAAFAVWKDADPRHEIAYAQAELDWADSERLVESEIGRTRKLVRAPLLMRHSTHLAGAGLGILVLLGAGTAGLLRYGSTFSVTSVAEAATYETAIGEIKTIALADGSQITLDTTTLVHVLLSSGQRRVELDRGRARFHVRPESKRPFTVVLSSGTVVARSKLFDVSVVAGRPELAVLEGQVALAVSNNDAREDVRTVSAGQSWGRGTGTKLRPISTGETRWVSGMLTLDSIPLDQATSAINRYNRVQIRLADPDLARLLVTGAFQVRKPDAFAQAVAATFGLIVDRPNPDAILLRPDI